LKSMINLLLLAFCVCRVSWGAADARREVKGRGEEKERRETKVNWKGGGDQTAEWLELDQLRAFQQRYLDRGWMA
jgi:hypothetical protein